MKTDTGADTVTHPEGQGRNPESRPVGVETVPASSSWTKAEPAPLMEAVVEKANMARAYRRVVANKGAPGADGMTVDQLADHLKQHWPTLRERLLASEYHPSHPSVIRPIAPDWRGACYLGTSLCRCGPYP